MDLADVERALPPGDRRRRRHDRGRGQPRSGRRHPRPDRYPPARARARHPGRRGGAAAAARAPGPCARWVGSSTRSRCASSSSTTRAGCRCCGVPPWPTPSSSSATTARGSACAGWGSSAASASPTCCPGSTPPAPAHRPRRCWACRGRRARRGSSAPSAPARCPTSPADDVVLLTGEATDRFTTVVARRPPHVRLHPRLGRDARPARGRPRPRPTDARAARPRGRQGAGGPARGRDRRRRPRGTRRPATCSRPRRPRWPRRGWARGRSKLAAEVSALAPWWGDRLRVLVLDARVNRTISGLATTLGFRIGRIAHHPAVRLELPREHAVVAVPAAPQVEAASASLPRRGRARRRPGLRLLARRHAGS